MVTLASTACGDLEDTDRRLSQANFFFRVPLLILVSSLLGSVCFLFPTSCCLGCWELIQRDHFHTGNIKKSPVLLMHIPPENKMPCSKEKYQGLVYYLSFGISRAGFLPFISANLESF